MEVGDRISSALDAAFLNYKSFCQRIGVPAASYSHWLQLERGLARHSVQLQSVAQRKAFQHAHKAEIAARRAQVIETYHL
jgi:hypothetical protein